MSVPGCRVQHRLPPIESQLLTHHILGDKHSSGRPFDHYITRQHPPEQAIVETPTQVQVEQRCLSR